MSKPEINVTPLIDVLLVLLIIFMVVTPMKPSSFAARIPSEPKHDDAAARPETIVVVVNSDSTLRLNIEQTTATVDDPAVLIEKLADIFRQRKPGWLSAHETEKDAVPRIEKTVFIKAPRGLDYGGVAKVVDAVKASGAAPISLQIDEPD